jgi:hypothetical protein
MEKITKHAIVFACLSLFFGCRSSPSESIDHADKNLLATAKYNFSHDANLLWVRAHAAQASAQEAQEAIGNLKGLLKSTGDSVSAQVAPLVQDAKSASDALTALVYAKVNLAQNLHVLNDLKRQFAARLGVNIVASDGNNLLSGDSTANLAVQQTYADVAIVKEMEYGNQIDALSYSALARHLERPKPPPIPGIIRRIFGR